MSMLASGMDLVSISGGNAYRPEAGRIFPYGGTTAPEGYLLCDGEAYSRTEYSELFEVIGTTFGSGDGSTTFNVPDLRGRTSIGANASHLMGTTGGEESHTLTVDEMPSHNHRIREEYGAKGVTDYPPNKTYAQVAGDSAGTKTWVSPAIENTGGSQAHNNMQPYQVVNYIICTGKKFPALKGETGDVGNVIHIGTTEPDASSAYILWYNPLNGALRAKQYVEPDSLTDGGWAWREMVFADEGKNGDVYMATADALEEAVIAG